VVPWVANQLPLTSIELWALAAVLWMAPPWLCAAGVVWALVVGLKERMPLLGCGVALVLAAFAGVPLPLRFEDTQGDGLSVFTTNVNAFSPNDTLEDRAALEARLAEEGAHVVLVLEKRPLSLAGYRRAADNFERDLPRISHATAVFCRKDVACEAWVSDEFGSETSVMPIGLVRVQGPLSSPVCLGALHAPPPVPKDWTGHLPHIDAIVSRLADGRLAEAWGPCEAGDPIVLSGDLNAVPRSTGYERLLDAGLSDPLVASGVFAATWPGGGGWPNAPYFQLDHVLVGAASVSGLRMETIEGADHRALGFSISEP
jgi:endonuclease/exonuclease/phosphatase (EEP) superfamily protein YafD